MLRSKLRSLGPEARIRMASGMFSAARELGRAAALASSPARGWDRKRMLTHFYSTDLSPSVIAAAARRLQDDHGTHGARSEG